MEIGVVGSVSGGSVGAGSVGSGAVGSVSAGAGSVGAGSVGTVIGSVVSVAGLVGSDTGADSDGTGIGTVGSIVGFVGFCAAEHPEMAISKPHIINNQQVPRTTFFFKTFASVPWVDVSIPNVAPKGRRSDQSFAFPDHFSRSWPQRSKYRKLSPV